MKKIILLLIISLPLLMQSFTATSHPGRTDANGGHYNHFTGEYHYHNNGTYQSRNSSSSSDGTIGYIYDPDTYTYKKADEIEIKDTQTKQSTFGFNIKWSSLTHSPILFYTICIIVMVLFVILCKMRFKLKRLVPFSLWMFFILLFLIIPLNFAIKTDNMLIFALPFILIYLTSWILVTYYISEGERQSDLNNIYRDKYFEESKKNDELQKELSHYKELLKSTQSVNTSFAVKDLLAEVTKVTDGKQYPLPVKCLYTQNRDSAHYYIIRIYFSNGGNPSFLNTDERTSFDRHTEVNFKYPSLCTDNKGREYFIKLLNGKPKLTEKAKQKYINYDITEESPPRKEMKPDAKQQ